MVLLDGTVGGSVNSLSWDFGTEEYKDKNGVTTTTQRLIKDIIRDAVHEYAKEPISNIIINDLDEAALELLEYRVQNQPAYIPINVTTGEPENITLDDAKTVYLNGEAIGIGEIAVYDPRVHIDMSGDIAEVEATQVQMSLDSDQLYTVAKISYGETPGYKQTDLVYAGDLILSVGNSITSMLDKIVNMLGEYEYFYDLYGRFIFQRKKTYINVSFNNIMKSASQTYVTNAEEVSEIQYNFSGSTLFSAISSSPKFDNLRNDFSI